MLPSVGIECPLVDLWLNYNLAEMFFFFFRQLYLLNVNFTLVQVSLKITFAS